MIETKLYHCTDFNGLKGILETEAFKPSYCLEQAGYLEEKPNFAFAMVCFADLMVSELSEHMKSFKSKCYLQMSKEWARKNHLSNVIYYEEKTTGAFAYREIAYMGLEKLIANKEKLDRFTIGVTFLMSLLKPYEGRYWNKQSNNWSENVTQFYNEREWRFIPIVKNNEHSFLEEQEFLNIGLRKQYWDELTNNSDNLLHFTWNDIEKIGIAQEHKDCIIDIISSHYRQSIDNIINKLEILQSIS